MTIHSEMITLCLKKTIPVPESNMPKARKNTSQDNELITLLMEHEIGMRTLYRGFAKQFPELETFWLKVAAEEQDHLKRLSALKKKISVKDEELYRDRMKIGAVKTSLYYLRRELAAVKNIRDINEAFSIALDFEHSMLEKKFFEIFNVFNSQVEKVMEFLEKETHKHIGDIKKQYDLIRKSQK